MFPKTFNFMHLWEGIPRIIYKSFPKTTPKTKRENKTHKREKQRKKVNSTDNTFHKEYLKLVRGTTLKIEWKAKLQLVWGNLNYVN